MWTSTALDLIHIIVKLNQSVIRKKDKIFRDE